MIFQDGSGPYSAYDGTNCTLIMSGSPNDNFGTCGSTTVGYVNAPNFYACRTLIKFDLSPLIPSNSSVTAAYLSIYLTSVYLVPQITAYALTRAWTEGTGTCSLGSSTTNASWNNYIGSSAWTIPGGDYSTTPASNSVIISSGGWVNFILDTSLVQGWLSNPSSNYGLILINGNESMTEYASIESDDATNVSHRPKLTVYYRLP